MVTVMLDQAYTNIASIQLKRMAFSMILCSIVEAVETEIATSKKKEGRARHAGEDDKRDNIDSVADTKTPQPNEEDIEIAAFKKFWNASAEWVSKLVMDVVLYAKDNSARDYDTLLELLRKKDEHVGKEDIKILFAKNVWASLRSRGWKATSPDGSMTEQQYSFGDEKVSVF